VNLEMAKYDLGDTIAAISTAIGESGIGIVRLSGRDALGIADKIFISGDSKKPSDFKTYTTHYGWIVDASTEYRVQSTEQSKNTQRCKPQAPEDIIDEVILTVMRAPKSYTKEDVVEINCHGGIIALRRVLELVLEKGARLAEPGEFTKRAFLNGRIDLAQAEAVLDIIRAKTDSALKIGFAQLKGILSSKINKIRQNILEILATLEANIDFPEEQIDAVNPEKISQGLNSANNQLQEILNSASRGRILREGINVVICGRPNVGKSSLLNALLRQERSIVTHIPGTTRDTIEEVIDIQGIPIKIVDTAGIIEPKGLIEKKAIQRSQRYIGLADVIILLFDGSKRLARKDEVLTNKLKKKPLVAVINKIDLKQRIERAKVLKKFPRLIEISAKKMKNINRLEEAIVDLAYAGRLNNSSEPVLVSNLRHIEAMKEAQKFIVQALNSLDNDVSIEFIAQDLKEALVNLDGVVGESMPQDLLDKIFKQFCIGK
jgi:tRNA modification GTPase